MLCIEAHKDIPPEWLEEFSAAARRSLETRLRYSFIKTYKPVLDDAPYRSFESTAEYRRWCEENLPDWLGYGQRLIIARWMHKVALEFNAR